MEVVMSVISDKNNNNSYKWKKKIMVSDGNSNISGK